MVIAFFTLYLTQKLGFSIGQAGMAMTCFGLGSVCGGLIGGRLVDRFGFHAIQIATLAGGGIMFYVLGAATSFPLICATAFVLALINDAFRPANTAAIAHYSAVEARTRSYALNRLAINLGWACGSALGGFIASFDYQWLFWVDGSTNIAAALLLALLLRPGGKAAQAVRKPASSPSSSSRSAYRDRPYLLFFACSILFAYCFFQIFTTLPVYFRTELHLPERHIGAIMSLNGLLIALVEMVLVHRLEGRRPIMLYIVWGVLLIAMSFFIYNLMPAGLLVALCSTLLVTFGEMLSMPFMNTFLVSRSQDGNRGQYAGLYAAAWSIGQISGPATGAHIASAFGFNTLWWYIGGLCLITASGYAYLWKKLR